MPELPEVETVRRTLAPHVTGRRIESVRFYAPQPANGAPDTVAAQLTGRRIMELRRHGKYLLFQLDEGWMTVHLRMTGKLRFAAPDEQPGKHDHVVITLRGGRRLFFNDTRKFGRFRLCSTEEDPFADLGPEPLDEAFTVAVLRERLAGKSRMIKPLLLDQSCVAGLGNIYVDESLWQARIHPERRADTLSAAEIRRLHAAIREVLQRAVDNCGTTLGTGEANFYSVAGNRGRNADRLNVFRREGLPCPRCGTLLARSVVGQRGTHTCPACQKAGE